jgi:aryl-alcohol dehydrogenase-like predicted oxidoreductase
MTGATPAATAAFARASGRRADFYRSHAGLVVSSVGLGTYLGAADGATDQAYAAAAEAAVKGGVNLLDTAANYRFQRSERALGEAVKRLVAAGTPRETLVVCTKGGYLAFDGAVPPDPKAWFEATFVKPGVADYTDIIDGVHCMAPRYLAHQVRQSLANLGVERIDVYYLHNPESQLRLLTPQAFRKRLVAAFAQLEGEVAAGRIGAYGVATWSGFRTAEGQGGYLALNDVAAAAREAAGGEPHFGFVQLPYNLAMTEALTLQNQGGHAFLRAAAELGLGVVTSAALLQGQVLGKIPDSLRATLSAQTDAQAALQFARSAPGVLTALVGMSNPAHVAENLAAADRAPVDAQTYSRFF